MGGSGEGGWVGTARRQKGEKLEGRNLENGLVIVVGELDTVNRDNHIVRIVWEDESEADDFGIGIPGVESNAL
jgi:hypothetical protein